MEVIDGVHRVRAAALRGDASIRARFFVGTKDDAFVVAVKNNVAHGLPLTLADRKAAAARIIQTHGHWSDRAIAAASGLSPKTVGALRPPKGDASIRVGRDGKARPAQVGEVRRLAGEYLSANPDASIGDVVKAVGVSAHTARDVRRRVDRGEVAIPHRRKPEPASLTDSADVLRHLRNDPSLRLTDGGRTLIRLLNAQAAWDRQSEELASSLPTHCTEMIVDVALACAQAWRQLADRVQDRATTG